MSSSDMSMGEYLNKSKTDPTMIAISTVAFSLELVYQILTLFFLPAYIYLSKFARRFHKMLRFQLRLLFLVILSATITRMIIVILRLLDTHLKALPPLWTTVINLSTLINLSIVAHLNMTICLIAVERFLAANLVTTYEESCIHPGYRVLLGILLIVPSSVISWWLFWSGAFDLWEDYLCWNVFNSIVSAFYVVGFVAMEASRIISERHLKNSRDRKLSSSFQCKENILVVGMFRPMFLFLFLVRIAQFAIQYYMFTVVLRFGPIPLRIASHLYDQCNGITFLLIPLILLKQHPGLTRFSQREEIQTRANGEDYFNTLRNQWM